MVELWNEVFQILMALKYQPNIKINDKNYDVWFYLEDMNSFPKRHMNAIEALLGDSLLEFYWESSLQHIYIKK